MSETTQSMNIPTSRDFCLAIFICFVLFLFFCFFQIVEFYTEADVDNLVIILKRMCNHTKFFLVAHNFIRQYEFCAAAYFKNIFFHNSSAIYWYTSGWYIGFNQNYKKK